MESHGLAQHPLEEGQGEARLQWESQLEDGPGLEQRLLEESQEKPWTQWARHSYNGHCANPKSSYNRRSHYHSSFPGPPLTNAPTVAVTSQCHH